MQIIDAQIHVWAHHMPNNPRHNQVKSFMPADVLSLMDEAGVDAAVIHPPSWEPEVIAIAKQAVRDNPGRFAVMGLLPLDDERDQQGDEQSRNFIAGWRSEPGILGLRCSLKSGTSQQGVHDGSLDWAWETAQNAGVPITALAADSLDDLGVIAERFPGLRLTVDHLGGSGGSTSLKDAAAMAHMPQLLALAKYPNIAVKATGIPGYAGDQYPFPAMQTYVRQVFDAFGPDRLFWGTDISKMPCSWRDCVTMFTEELPWLSDADKICVMGDALCDWWGWAREK
jgi:predicted TIM-barrel fold metal-dependent hydrolase